MATIAAISVGLGLLALGLLAVLVLYGLAHVVAWLVAVLRPEAEGAGGQHRA
jgi:hypothetical protein